MLLRKLYLHHFRCCQEVQLEFEPGINVIVGANAQGKTSILEAIHLLMTGRSFRTTQSKELIQNGAQTLYVEALFEKHGIEQTLRIAYNEKERKIVHNQTNYSSPSNLLGILQGVVTTPDDITLVKNAPMHRRHFLDMQIAQVDPLYVHHLTRYHRAMRQRNVLLRAKNIMTIESWEHEMAASAAYLVKQRLEVASSLHAVGGTLYHSISGEKETLNVSYLTQPFANREQATIQQHYLGQFNKMRNREMALGHTLVGPHKDDLAIFVGERDARGFASEGQQRSCVAALRLAEWERLRIESQSLPLLLIDDIGMGLDRQRYKKLLMHIQQHGQVFVTTTESLELPCKEHRLPLNS